MHGGLPLLVSDPQADPRLAASQSIAISGIQSAMCAPLGNKDRRLGLLYVDNLSRRGMFTVEDLNVFTVIATQAGLAIDRARQREVPADEPQTSPALKLQSSYTLSNFAARRLGAVLSHAATSAFRKIAFFIPFNRTHVAPRLPQ